MIFQDIYGFIFLKSKVEAAEMIKGCVTRIENQLDARLKVMKSDNRMSSRMG